MAINNKNNFFDKGEELIIDHSPTNGSTKA